ARAALGLGTAATMSPAEIAADPALSATFARADDRRTAGGLWYTAMNARELTTQALSNAAWAFFDQRIVIPFDGTVTAMMCEVTTAGGAGAKIYMALFEETSPVQTDPLRLVAALGTVDADSTGNKEKTGLSIPVTAGQTFRPALKGDGSGTAPTVRAHRGNAPLTTRSTGAISGQHFGQTIRTSAGAGDFTGDLDVPAAAPAVRTALLVVPS